MARRSFILALLAVFPWAAARADDWEKQAAQDAKQDRTKVVYDGVKPNSMVCDTTLRELPDGSWVLLLLAGGDIEPSPKNYTGITRSTDQGKTWSALRPLDVGFPREGKTIGQGPTELMVRDGRCTLFFSTHSSHWGHDWKCWVMRSDDSCRTWSKPEAVPDGCTTPASCAITSSPATAGSWCRSSTTSAPTASGLPLPWSPG